MKPKVESLIPVKNIPGPCPGKSKHEWIFKKAAKLPGGHWMPVRISKFGVGARSAVGLAGYLRTLSGSGRFEIRVPAGQGVKGGLGVGR